MVGDNTFWEAVEFSDVVEKESGCFFCYDYYVCWNEVYSFGDRIHDSHDGIISRGLQKFDHEVDTEHVLLYIWNGKQLKLTNWRVSPRFHLKVEIAGTHILADVPQHLRLPVVLGHQF